LGPLADYIVINISSPNTPGLVGLQKRDPLRRLLTAAIETRNDVFSSEVTEQDRHGRRRHHCPPLLVKISPDLTEEEMVDIAEVVMDCGVDGMVVCNTTQERPDSLVDTSEYKKGQEGGLSGAPLRERSTECIRTMYRLTGGKVPIIGVGGVASGQDVYEKLRAGASLVQLYSLLVYKGPGLVSRVRDELAQLMVQNGHRHIQDIVGLDHDEIYWTKRQAEAQQALLLASRSQQRQQQQELNETVK
jgi:dihydroorotate dehydrogenase